MPKVLQIINRYNLGGHVYSPAYLTKYLQGEFSTKIIGGPPRSDERDAFFVFEKLGITPVVLPEMSPKLTLTSEIKAFYAIKKVLKEYAPDIVHTHVARAGIIGRYTARKSKVPIVLHTFHGHHFYGYTNKFFIKIYRQLEKYLSSISDAVIVLNNRQKRDLVEVFGVIPEEKCYVIPNGFDVKKFLQIPEEIKLEFKEKFSLPDDKIILAAVGRLAPVKNHKLLVEAIDLLPRSLLNKIRVLIVGDGSLKTELLRQIRNKGLGAGEDARSLFVFTSWVTDVREVYANADIVVLTSLNEGAPVSLVEAQASGVPVISTRVGGVEDVVKHKETGLLVPPNNPSELAKAIKELVEDEEKRKRFGEEGQKFVSEHFSVEKFIEKSKKLYYKLLTEKRML